MKKISKKSLLQASQLSYKRQVWQSLEELRSLREWSGQKTEFKVVPPLPFKKFKTNYISLIRP